MTNEETELPGGGAKWERGIYYYFIISPCLPACLHPLRRRLEVIHGMLDRVMVMLGAATVGGDAGYTVSQEAVAAQRLAG